MAEQLSKEQLAAVQSLAAPQTPQAQGPDSAAIDSATRQPLPDEIEFTAVTQEELDAQAKGEGAEAEETPSPDDTATDQAEAAGEDTGDGDDTAEDDAKGKTVKPKRGVQKRIDELTGLYRSEQRAREATQAQLTEALALLKKAGTSTNQTGDTVPQPPVRDDFEDDTEYAVEMAMFKMRQEAQEKQEAEQRQQKVTENQQGLVEAAQKLRSTGNELFEDFDAVALGEHVTYNATMTEIVTSLERGAEVAYHLGQNPDEALRISKLPLTKQAVELSTIEQALNSASNGQEQPGKTQEGKPAQRTTGAPEPVKRVTPSSSGERPLDTGSYEDYRKARGFEEIPR